MNKVELVPEGHGNRVYIYIYIYKEMREFTLFDIKKYYEM